MNTSKKGYQIGSSEIWFSSQIHLDFIFLMNPACITPFLKTFHLSLSSSCCWLWDSALLIQHMLACGAKFIRKTGNNNIIYLPNDNFDVHGILTIG